MANLKPQRWQHLETEYAIINVDFVGGKEVIEIKMRGEFDVEYPVFNRGHNEKDRIRIRTIPEESI